MADPFRATRRLIRAERKNRRQSQQAVADAIGMKRVVYSQMENGPRKIMALELAALCEFWKVSYSTLFPTN